MFQNEYGLERGGAPYGEVDERWRRSGRGFRQHRRGGCGQSARGHDHERAGEPLPPPGMVDPSEFEFFEQHDPRMRCGEHGGRGGPRGREGMGFGWGFGGPRGRGHGHGQPDRPLETGDLRWLTLDLIAAQPRHGYEIIKAIADALHGQYTPSPGVIYPTLTLLEETGLISGEAKGAKKLYSLTEEGKTEIEAHAADIRAARARLAEAGGRFGGRPAPELVRAMNNLRASLQVRLAKGELSAEALGKITAALDRAATEIERC